MRKILLFIILFAIALPGLSERPKVGLVLGGGGAKGAAEVGVLKVIAKAGIPIDCIAGTSIGSIIGGLYAAGYSPAQLDTMFQTQEWLGLLTDRRQELGMEPYKVQDGVTYIFGFPIVDRNSTGFGLMKGERIERFIDSLMSKHSYSQIEDLPIPFWCVAADFMAAKEVILSEGNISKAIRASMAIPGVFKPVRINGQQLVDGGMLNNLPVDVVKAMGADIVIAIDLQQNEQKLRKNSNIEAIKPLGDLLGVGGLIDWVANRPDILKYLENHKLADICITPPIADYDASSFGNKNAARMIAIGEQEALRHWGEFMALKDLLGCSR